MAHQRPTRLFLIIVLLTMVNCQKPSDFELVNRHDPESPNYILDPATFFSVFLIQGNTFRFRWEGGTANRSYVELIRITGTDTLFLYNDIHESTEIDFHLPERQNSPFTFKMRMSMNGQVSNWLKSYTFGYVMNKPTIHVQMIPEGSITVSWDRNTPNHMIESRDGIGIILLPNSTIVLDKSVNGAEYQTLGSFETINSYVDSQLPAAGETIRYRVTGFYQDATAGPTESAIITLPAQ